MEKIVLAFHLVFAATWVGGQVVMGALVPTLRSIDPTAPNKVAQAFGRIAWPAYGLAIVTGLANFMLMDQNDVVHPAFEIKFLFVLISGVGAALHVTAKGRKPLLAAGGAMASLGAVGALMTAVWIGA